ncbi:MAG: hypothetical protein HKN33_06610 [Pyrinomonadaceae bacterium]|nr:hypothetical protein [Pyrinomonadaceae bacterium]
MKQMVTEFIDDLKSVDNISVTALSRHDDSVIDVTGAYEQIDYDPTGGDKLVRYGHVPKWEHMYVYSSTDIEFANGSQRGFYNAFRNSFLRGEYLDIEGNTNYAFILLFDLLNDYESHRDLLLVERQLEKLKLICPKTESYGRDFLTDLMESAGDYHGADRINTEYYKQRDEYFGNDYWTLGKRYRKELNPSETEEKLLRYISDPSNVFCDIEFCFLEVLKLLLRTITAIDKTYKEEGTSFEAALEAVTDTVATKNYHTRRGTDNYRYTLESVKREFFIWLFRNCENTVRHAYRHTRKLKIDPFYPYLPGKTEHISDIQNRTVTILPSLISTLTQPDKTTEISLNALSTTRWKEEFKYIKRDFEDSDLSRFIDRVITLAEINKKNRSVENIYFEASKFLAKKDQKHSVEMYLRYLHADLHSDSINNKQHTKTIQKALFSTNDQLHQFQVIISKLFVDRDLEQALETVPRIYAPRRKKIKLVESRIQEVQQKHSETVVQLDKYLNDEYEDADTTLIAMQNDHEEIEIRISPKVIECSDEPVIPCVDLSPVHNEMLELFLKSNFEVSAIDLEKFAESNEIFKNQLIDEINDACVEMLDDVLVEEEDENFVIYEPYYRQIMKNED